MCGIAGSLDWQSSIHQKSVEDMLSSLHHRGPDAGQVINLSPMVLGHRRLSIIDINARSNQPMHDHSGRFYIVFNGAIYNFKELRKKLKSKGAIFKTDSDTETIIEAWKFWGKDCLTHLTGMFAFALWDKEEEELFLARDRMGEKPLYYSFIDSSPEKGVVFASELTALLKYPEITKEINHKAVSQFLSLNYILTQSSIIKNIHKLPPAHYLLLKKNKTPILKQYWNLSSFFQKKQENETKKSLENRLNLLLENSVNGQMISDVPLGAFLSGGLDSSSIVAKMAKQDNPISSFSIGFNEKSYCELDDSKKVANYLGTNHHTKVISPNIDDIISIISKLDEPLADTSIIPTYYLSSFTKEKTSVALSGDGSDELFAGYETNIADQLHWVFSKLPSSFSKLLYYMADKIVPVSHNKVSFDYKLKNFLYGLRFDYKRAHYSWRQIFRDEEKSFLLNDNIKESVLGFDPFETFNDFYNDVKGCHIIDQSSYVDIKTWLSDSILVKLDRMSMANSLETRAPFLDHKIVEFAVSLPVKWKIRLGQKKYLLKQSQKPFLPPETINKTKRGFNSPISIWLNGKMGNKVKDICLDFRMNDWFNKAAIETLFDQHKLGKQDNSLRIFSLMCFSIWLEKLKNI